MAKLLWSEGASAASSIVANGLLAVDMGSPVGERQEATILRTVGWYIARKSSGVETLLVYTGLILADEDSPTQEDPELELDADWMFWNAYPVVDNKAVFMRDAIKLDLRSKRRLRESDRTYVLVFKNAGGIDTVDIAYSMRALWLIR